MLRPARMWIAEGSVSELIEEHLSGGRVYGVLSAGDGRHRGFGGGVARRRGAADRDDPHARPGPGVVSALAPWRRPVAVHDPAKVLLDLAVATAVGGDCLADIAVLRGDPGVFGHVASDPTVSRVIDRLAVDAPRVLAAIDRVRAHARALVWRRAGRLAPDHGIDAEHPLIIDVDATLVTAHSEKEHAAPTFKRGFGFHPLLAFVDHGPIGSGEPVAMLLRPGNAGSQHRRRPPHGDPGRAAPVTVSHRGPGRPEGARSAPTRPAARTRWSTG